jgi:hypothetical protein
MKHLSRLAYLFLFLAVCSCGGAPSAPATPRSAARAAVDVAKDAWVLVANACVDAAQVTNSKALLHKCAAPLTAARVLLLVAADAVDGAWTAQAGCDVLDAVLLVAKGAGSLGAYGVSVLPVVQDAVMLATGVAGSACQTADASPPAPEAAPALRGEDAVDDNPYDLDAPDADEVTQ